jgi:drug/metabolite transporter (DMT)-like permease
MLIPVALSLAGAALNATASVAQRAESRKESDEGGSMLRMLLDLAARPGWWVGIAAMIGGFACEAVALTVGQIAIVEPVMIIELPLTIIGARLFLGRRPARGAWASLSRPRSRCSSPPSLPKAATRAGSGSACGCSPAA